MESHPAYGLVGTGLKTIDTDGHTLESIPVRISDEDIRKNILKDSQFAHASVIIRKEALDSV